MLMSVRVARTIFDTQYQRFFVNAKTPLHLQRAALFYRWCQNPTSALG
jgi:hypothetical protein